jgi:hypothetical protein
MNGTTQSQEAPMAKIETIFCALTCGLTNALFFAVAFGSANPVDRTQNSAVAEVASVMSEPTA